MPEDSVHPEKYRHDLEVVRDTALQVIKDFGWSGVEITFSGDPMNAYRELITQVLPALKNLYNNDRASLMVLLYRIDVDERKVKNIAATTEGADFFIKLTELVIEREFLKVLIRKMYGSGKK